MRQIINGKLYSTDSATLKVYWDNAGYESHEMADAYFHEVGVKDDFVAQSLYRTKEGEYFLWITEMATNTSVLELMPPTCLMNWLNDHDFSDEELARILEVEIA